MMTAMMSGEELKKKKVELHVEIPEVLAEGVGEIAAILGVSEGEVLSNMATEGINKFLSGVTNRGHNITEQLMNKVQQPELDLGPLKDTLAPLEAQFGKLGDLIEQLNKMQKEVESATVTIPDTKDPEES
jgi:hypothetical protein